MTIDYIEGRNLQTEVLQRMNVDQLNSAATSYRPDLRASKADSLTWVNMWNSSGHMCRANIMDCGDHAHVELRDEDTTQITVTLAGRLQYAGGNPYMEFAGYAVRRDGRELARFDHRDDAEAHARKIAAFIRATDAQVLALPALA